MNESVQLLNAFCNPDSRVGITFCAAPMDGRRGIVNVQGSCRFRIPCFSNDLIRMRNPSKYHWIGILIMTLRTCCSDLKRYVKHMNEKR